MGSCCRGCWFSVTVPRRPLTVRRHWPRPCSGNAPAAAMAESFWILTSRPGGSPPLCCPIGAAVRQKSEVLLSPPSYAGAAEHPTVIVNTAISGGSFETHIREELARYGGGRNVALTSSGCGWTSVSPARSGQGRAADAGGAGRALEGASARRVFLQRPVCPLLHLCQER